jgi:hypothetical protein
MSKYIHPLFDDDGNEYDDLLYSRCVQCGAIKSNDEFYSYKYLTYRDSKDNHCIICRKSNQLEYYHQNKERLNENRRRKRDSLGGGANKKHSITCPICGTDAIKERHNAIYCSTKCRAKHHNRKRKQS